MSGPEEDNNKTARHALWVNTTLNRYYSLEGDFYSNDAAAHLYMALEALEDDTSARKVARLLASSRPENSDAATALTHWWLSNLRADEQVTPWQRLDELAQGRACPYYEAQLGCLLTDPVTAQTALETGLKQIELGGPLAMPAHNTIEAHAIRLASITPDVALFPLLQHAHTHDLVQLRTATRAELHRVPPVTLEHWYDEARKLENSAVIKSDLSAAYLTNITALCATDAAEAWRCIDGLEQRWNNGRPAIVKRTAAPVATVFNAYATAKPWLASYISARNIKAAPSATARLSALADTQQQVSTLPPPAQLVFLAQLHARLMDMPELVRPSREQLLTLHRAYPDAGVTQTLNELALGDIVLQNYLAPEPPPAAHVPPPPPSPLKRLRNWLVQRLP